MSDLLAIAFTANGKVNDVSLQCVVEAARLAGEAGGKADVLAIGSGIGDAAASLFGYGAAGVYAADDAALEQYLSGSYAAVVKSFLEGKSYGAVLVPATTSGNDLAPYAATLAGGSAVIDADKVELDGGSVKAWRLEFDRKVHTAYTASEKVMLVTLKDGIADVPAPDASASGSVESVAVDLSGAVGSAKVVSRDVVGQTVNLKDARIIVGAGAGIGSKDNFSNIEALAKALDAQIGATRAVVDAGWLPADHQIGQTGSTVKPDVYIACGISGAVQHWVGVSEAKKIVSINTDKNAPMMKRAHYRVEGDLNEVIPKLVQLLG